MISIATQLVCQIQYYRETTAITTYPTWHINITEAIRQTTWIYQLIICGHREALANLCLQTVRQPCCWPNTRTPVRRDHPTSGKFYSQESSRLLHRKQLSRTCIFHGVKYNYTTRHDALHKLGLNCNTVLSLKGHLHQTVKQTLQSLSSVFYSYCIYSSAVDYKHPVVQFHKTKCPYSKLKYAVGIQTLIPDNCCY